MEGGEGKGEIIYSTLLAMTHLHHNDSEEITSIGVVVVIVRRLHVSVVGGVGVGGRSDPKLVGTIVGME